MPLATAAAVHILAGRLFREHEVIFLSFVASARCALQRASYFFILPLGLLYALLVCYIAPECHFRGKQLILQFAKERLNQLEPGCFHYPAPGVMVFFKEKQYRHIPRLEARGTHFIDM